MLDLDADRPRSAPIQYFSDQGILNSTYSFDWSERLNNCDDFRRFKHLQRDVSPSPLWYLAKCSPYLCQTYKNVAKLWCIPPNCELSCAQCKLLVDDAVAHCILDCSSTTVSNLRDVFLTKIVNDYPVNVYVTLVNSCREVQIASMLGSPPTIIADLFQDADCLLASFAKDCCIFVEKASLLTFN